jgi:MFS family permease
MTTTPAPRRADGHAVEAQVMRKVTKRLIPFLGLLYFVNYLDRVNIAFAGPNGMNEDLGLSSTAFGFAAGIFFLGYLIFEVPSNIALNRFGGRRWLARIMITWGVISTAIAFTPNATVLVLLRFLLGVAEAGFFPGIILYLTFWFPKKQRIRAVALFMAAIPISSAVGSTLSSMIIEWGHGALGLEGWRVMFLIEGIPALALAVVTWFYLTDQPSEATWLADDEKAWLTRALDEERAAVSATGHWPLRRALTHPRILALAFVYVGLTYGLYAVSFYLPSIVAGFEASFGTHLSIVQKGLLTSVPFVAGTLAMIPWGRYVARVGFQAWHFAAPATLAGVSIPVALYLDDPYLVMLAVTLCAVGVFSALPTFWSLPSSFLTGAAAAGGIALINSIGSFSGFGGPYVTGWLTDLSGDEKLALWVVGAMALASAGTAMSLHARISRELRHAEAIRNSALTAPE